MASSIIDIQTIYGTMLTELVRDPDVWISFLNCAGMNYKYNFNEQLLIYSQKPSAIACAETKFWNKKMHRWVRKGSKGIALLDSTKRSGLRYVFDVSDTTDYYNKKLKLWEVKLDYENEIIESLEANYGTLENKDDFAGAILSAISNSVEDNIQDYFDSLMKNTYGSNLANMDELTIQMEYKSLLINSVAYMVLTRTGLNPFDYIKREDFYYVQSFNSFNSIVTLGVATSDISENILRNIEVCVRNIEKNKNCTFALNNSNNYNVEKDKGRIHDYERKIEDNIQTGGRLFDTKYSSTNTEEGSREIRENENEIFEGEQSSNLSIIANEKSIERPFDRSAEISTGENRQLDRENENTGEYNRRIESDKSNGLGRSNEQYQEQSRGNSVEGVDFQLENDNKRKFLTENERKSNLNFLQDEYVSKMIANAELKESKEKIKQFYQLHKDKQERIEYVKNIFSDAYTEIVVDGERLGFKTYENVLHFWKDSYLNRTAEVYYTWETIADYIDGMIMVNELSDLSKNIINIDNQIQLASLLPDTTPPLLFTQELIDTALQNGSGFKEGKYRIYEQFNRSLSKDENVKFLKKEYGIGGGSSVHVGTNIGYQYDSKGIELHRGDFDDKKSKLLNWIEVEKRINELIKLDRYLNPKEKEEYPKWLDKNEQERQLNESKKQILEQQKLEEDNKELELATKLNKFLKDYEFYNYIDNTEIYRTEQENIEIIKADLSDRRNLVDYVRELKNVIDNMEQDDELHDEAKEMLIELEKRLPKYEYHLGDIVYLGSNEFEISDIGISDITLLDVNFPLINKVMPKKVFEQRLADTISNDHLLVFNSSDSEEKNIVAISDNNNEEENNLIQEEPIDGIELKPKFIKQKISRIQNYNLHPEIAESERLNFKIQNEELGIGTPREKFARNIEAIKVLKKCESENRYASSEEQEILSQYIGWGGLADVFDKNNTKWVKEYNILKELLTDEEYENAKESTLTSFYTPPIVIDSIYQALQNMGLKNGNILEPSCRNWKFFRNVT